MKVSSLLLAKRKLRKIKQQNMPILVKTKIQQRKVPKPIPFQTKIQQKAPKPITFQTKIQSKKAPMPTMK